MNRLPVLFGVPFLTVAISLCLIAFIPSSEEGVRAILFLSGIVSGTIGLLFVLGVGWIRHLIAAAILLLWILIVSNMVDAYFYSSISNVVILTGSIILLCSLLIPTMAI